MKKEICMSCVNGIKALVPNNSSITCFCTHYNDVVYKSKEDICKYYVPRTYDTEMELAIKIIQDMATSLQVFPDSRTRNALVLAIDALKDKRPEGEWLKDEEYGTANRICPFCGAYDTDQLHTNFCARCGAKLNGEASGIKKKMQDAKISTMFDDLSYKDKIDAITNGKCKSKLLRIKEEILNKDFKDKIEIDQNFISDMKECARDMAIKEGDEDFEHAGDNLFKHENPVYVPLNEIIEVIDKYINDDCPIEEEPDLYYLVYFYINSDGDFYVKEYLGINDEYKLFLDVNDAIDAIKKHFKTAIDSIKSEKHARVKEYWEKLYNDPATWTNWFLDGGDELFNISEDFGNYSIEYSIWRVRFFKEKEE